MKAQILSIIMLAAAICGNATTGDEAAAVKPETVLIEVEQFMNKYGIMDKRTVVEKRNSADDALESKLVILPYKCPNGQGIITKLKEAFLADKDIAMECGLYEPRQGTLFKAYTGKTTDQYVNTRTSLNQGLYYICTKNPDNPLLRDQIAVNFTVEGNEITGEVFLITSLRRELVEPATVTKIQDFDFSDAHIDMDQARKELAQAHKDLEQARKEFEKLRGNAAGYTPTTAGLTYKPEQMSAGRQLKALKDLLEMQNQQINNLEQRWRNNPHNYQERRNINKRLRQLHKQAQQTTNKMQKLINKLR